MKINPIGIAAYQQTSLNRRPGATPSNETAGNKTSGANKSEQLLVVPSRENVTSSQLATASIPGDMLKLLSPEERETLQNLFKSYAERSQLNNSRPAFARVDIKV